MDIVSTGGLIAIALGIKQLPVSEVIERFSKIVDRGFAPRIATFSLSGAKYRTRPLEHVLAECLGESYIFGGAHAPADQYATKVAATKVAVTSATDTAHRAVVHANYNRQDSGSRGKHTNCHL